MSGDAFEPQIRRSRFLGPTRRGSRVPAPATSRLRIFVARNVRVGRLELDLIAQRGVLIVFCEVRSRSDARLMTPAQTIGPLKVRRVRHAAAQWLRHHHHSPVQVRFDVASIVFDTPGGRLNYLEGAF